MNAIILSSPLRNNECEELDDFCYFWIINNQFLIFLSLVLFCSCKKADVVSYTTTKLIAHRGNGSIASGLGQSEENNLAACDRGFSLTDGVEIDVQRSNDYVVYMFHDISVEACEDHDIKSIPASTSEIIEKQFKCIGRQPDLFKSLLEQNSILSENKDIFVEVKSIAGFSTVLKMPTPQHYLNLMAQDLFALLEEYPYQSSINIESENGVLLNAFEKHYPKVNTWLASYGDFEKAVRRASKENYTGISIKDGDYITTDQIENAHNAGIKVCVWVVNDQARYDKLKEMKADYVQTDNLYLEI